MTRSAALITLGSLILGLTAMFTTRWTFEPSTAFGPSDGSTITASCTDPTAASFTPDQTITLTAANPSASSFDCQTIFNFSIALTGAVNSDSNPSDPESTIACSSGEVRAYWSHPSHKLAGLQCQASSGSSQLTVAGDATDNTAVSYRIGNSSSTFATATQVDNDATADTLYGTSGIISTSALSDGSDGDSTVNGEIVFGGSSIRFHSALDFSNYNLSSDTEALTYSFTAQ
jgi:hypothetical protein